jgi:hypothetical protein
MDKIHRRYFSLVKDFSLSLEMTNPKTFIHFLSTNLKIKSLSFRTRYEEKSSQTICSRFASPLLIARKRFLAIARNDSF